MDVIGGIGAGIEDGQLGRGGEVGEVEGGEGEADGAGAEEGDLKVGVRRGVWHGRDGGFVNMYA